MHQLDLNLLKVFAVLYQQRNMTRAAEILNLSPSAVSHAMSRLRLQLDDALFVRHGKTMQPTPLCKGLAPQLLDALAQLQQVLQTRSQFDPAHCQQNFRIGVHAAFESMILPALLHQLTELAPKASITASHSQRAQMRKELAAGQLDMIIDVAMPVSVPVHQQSLIRDQFCVLSRKSDLAPDLQSYIQADHVTVSYRATGPVLEDQALQHHDLQRRIRLRCQSYQTAVKVIQQSAYMLTMPRLLAQPLLNDEISCHSMPFDCPDIDIAMFWHDSSHHDPALRWFRAMMVELCHKMTVS